MSGARLDRPDMAVPAWPQLAAYPTGRFRIVGKSLQGGRYVDMIRASGFVDRINYHPDGNNYSNDILQGGRLGLLCYYDPGIRIYGSC
jgi:hypothetical protein